MKYGHFDDGAFEYAIDRPDTPRAWSNYLGSRKYGGIITHHAGGYSFTRSPAEGRILRHRYNSVPMDMPGRQFYLRDCASGDFWSAAWQPCAKPLDQFQTVTRFGPGYAIIESTYDSIRTEATYFIPLDAEFEVWHLKVSNTGSAPRELSVFSFCEFTTEWNLMNDLLNLQYTQYIGSANWENGAIHASSCKHLPEDLGNFSNRDQSRHWWMTQSGGTIVGHDCDREAFIGSYGDFRAPAAVASGACTGSVGFSDNTCGAIQSSISLQPGESADIIVLLGIGKGQAPVENAKKLCGSPEGIASELSRLRAHWHGLLSSIQVKTPDADFDHMVNVWGAYNALMTFEWSRSCSLVYTGDSRDGYGYRDTVQDCLGVTGMIASEVRERLLLMLSAQDSTGGAQPEVRPWSHRPGQMPPTPPSHYRSDDCLWFFNSIPAYVAESSDKEFYRLVVPYADSGEASVLGHLRRALEFNLERTGANGLPCGLLADWNDCLKLGYYGESIFVAFQLRFGLETYAQIATEFSETAESEWALKELHLLDEKIQTSCWDGKWFRWAIGADGTVFGSEKSPEGKIYLNTQCWAVLSGAATDTQAASSLDAVKEQLAGKWGVALCSPPFAKTSVEVMRAVLFNPGNKENGGIFSHTQSWIVLAEIARGHGDQAYAYYRSFLPSAQNDCAEIREIEPFVHCQSTHSQFSEKQGKSRVPWLSGTASWAHFTATNHILGIQPEAEGLRVDPCIPSSWDGFSVTRKLRGKTLHIEIKNPARKNSGVQKLQVDGKEIEGNFLPENLLCDGSKILATLG